MGKRRRNQAACSSNRTTSDQRQSRSGEQDHPGQDESDVEARKAAEDILAVALE